MHETYQTYQTYQIHTTKDQKIYSFTPNNDWLNNTTINKTITQNDTFESHSATILMEGRLVIYDDKPKFKQFSNKIVRETYEEYTNYISNYDKTKDQWIYNILDGTREQEQILYQDDKILIIPNYKWNYVDINKLHILVIPKDKTLRSIRSLNNTHIKLLQHCKSKTCEIIAQTYGINSDMLKMYFHYTPSTWHLHIHFVHLNSSIANSSVEYCHELSTVIYNLEIFSDYYKGVLNKRI